jgi:hypothetical protein
MQYVMNHETSSNSRPVSRQSSIDQGWPTKATPRPETSSSSLAKPALSHNSLSSGLLYYSNGPRRAESKRRLDPPKSTGYNVISPPAPEINPAKTHAMKKHFTPNTKPTFSDVPDSVRSGKKLVPPPEEKLPISKKKPIPAPPSFHAEPKTQGITINLEKQNFLYRSNRPTFTALAGGES